MYKQTIGVRTYAFADLKALLAKASPARSGDDLAGVAAESDEERMAARLCLADLPLTVFLQQALIPYEDDEVTRLILDTHDRDAFARDLASHGRRFPQLAAARVQRQRCAGASCPRHNAGNGGSGVARSCATRT